MNYRFVNLQPLKSGGNADLYSATRNDTGERVVIKYLRECQDPYARHTFEREVRILSRGLPGLMHIVHSDLRAEQPYYVMPFLSGTLTQHAGRLSDQQIFGVAISIATTLATLHSLQIAHGDVKPDNILVAYDGTLQVADPLGNGNGCTVLWSANHGGTPGYWAPEVRNGGQISNAGDVYSFGATLYHLLVGRKPQDGLRLDLPPHFCRRAPKVCEIIALCGHSDPQARPTMHEVLQLLNGTAWESIRSARSQKQALTTAAVVIGGLLLVACLADA